MKKLDKLILISLILFCVGFFALKSSTHHNRPLVLDEIPFQIERENPVPMVKKWDEGKRTLYYFNWGEKPTGGYVLNFLEVKKGVIRLQAIEPPADEMTTQALTYPHLLISLPKGVYRYEVLDGSGRKIRDAFKTKSHPLQFTLILPTLGGAEAQRQVWRDQYQRNEGKTMAQIALEALFAQEEMAKWTGGVRVLGTSYDELGWYVLLSQDFDALETSKRQQLVALIEENVLELEIKNLDRVIITTNAKDLPPIAN